MKKLSLIFFIFLLVGCSSAEPKSLEVIGDLTENFDLQTLYEAENKSFEKMDYKDTKMLAIDAGLLLSKLPLIYEKNRIYLKSADGFMNSLDGESLNGTYIGYSDEYGWAFVSDKHPPNSGIRGISEILIVNDTGSVNHAYGLNIVDPKDKTTLHYSVGELYLKPYRSFAYLDGISEKTTEGKTYKVPGMKLKKVLSLSDLTDKASNLSLMMTNEGDYEYFFDEGYIELNGTSLNYIIPKTYDVYNGLQGIMINPPQMTVMDTYEAVRSSLSEPVMVIFIDGFSYNQYEVLKETDAFMKSFACEKANTIFKPVTNAGYAAMITGQIPKVNGVLDRSYRTLNKSDIFSLASEQGKSSVIIEGNIKILDTSVEPILNLDKNDNGMTDDEIFESALENLDNDFVFVHFHSLDEYGHDYGDMDKRTLDQMFLLDGYVEELVSKWDGHVIITADHGMHTTSEGGSHGEFRYEDLIIPFMWGDF
ncbi:hypothetical protein EZV73_10985 [Acidaminobacter sp. JC074]|uniref:alkaline phosphatase family protein n=1 Tax=Acidaminobacter sp. JC074 TaxID=2530199 RepID=UPI001F10715A|nr:alkaline phosphatase family protein [Acidaminobacter sp. JC074]MCH4888101.1 hypothetical protein [Acidaminobacter sp. JC074]